MSLRRQSVFTAENPAINFEKFIGNINSNLDNFYKKNNLQNEPRWSIESNNGTENTPGKHYRIYAPILSDEFANFLSKKGLPSELKAKQQNEKVITLFLVVQKDDITKSRFSEKDASDFLFVLHAALTELQNNIAKNKLEVNSCVPLIAYTFNEKMRERDINITPTKKQ